MLPTLPRKKIRDEVAQRLKALITAEQLVPGDRLPTESELAERFGVWGREMAERAQGRDDRVVGGHQPVKSLGREHTFGEDARDPVILLATLRRLAEQVAQDVREASVKFKNIELKVRFASFETRTRRTTLRASSSSARAIENSALRLFLPFLDRRENPYGRAIRLLGVRVAQLTVSPLR